MTRPVDPAPAGERVAKLLARAGVASRREVERMIAEGRVARGGVPLDTAATVLPSLDGVTVDGQPVARPEPARLFLYHKPTGLLVTERDPRGRPTIYDRLPKGFDGDLPRVVPVGRLDLNTEGLLLLTTDGGLKRQLELPATGVERSYRARAYGPVSQAQLEGLMDGVEIEGVRYGPINANLERRTGANTWIELTLTEGKNREVRRVLEHLGLQVGRLIRTRYGPFVLGDLPPGEVGEVRQADLVAFRQAVAAKRPAGPERVAVSTPARRPAARSAAPARSKARPGESRGPGAVSPKGSTPPPSSDRASQDRSLGRQSEPAPRPRSSGNAGGNAKPSASQLDPGLRRGSGNSPPGPIRQPRPDHPHPSKASRLLPSPTGGGRSSAPAKGEAAQGSDDAQHRWRGRGGEGDAAPEARPGFRTPATTDRAARSAARRKPGWAKPKPKSGPKRPRKS